MDGMDTDLGFVHGRLKNINKFSCTMGMRCTLSNAKSVFMTESNYVSAVRAVNAKSVSSLAAVKWKGWWHLGCGQALS